MSTGNRPSKKSPENTTRVYAHSSTYLLTYSPSSLPLSLSGTLYLSISPTRSTRSAAGRKALRFPAASSHEASDLATRAAAAATYTTATATVAAARGCPEVGRDRRACVDWIGQCVQRSNSPIIAGAGAATRAPTRALIDRAPALAAPAIGLLAGQRPRRNTIRRGSAA